MSNHLRTLTLGVALLAAACGKSTNGSSSGSASAAASTTSGGSAASSTSTASSSGASSASTSSGSASSGSASSSTAASSSAGSTSGSTGASASASSSGASTSASGSNSTNSTSGPGSTGSTGSTASTGNTSGGTTGSTTTTGTTGFTTGTTGFPTTGSTSGGGTTGFTTGGTSGTTGGTYDGGTPVYPNDTCATATLLTPQHVGESQSLNGTNLGGSAETASSCGGYGPDVYYRLHVAEAASLAASVSAGDAGFSSPVVYLTTPDCAPGADGGGPFGASDLYCASSFQTALLNVASLSPGDYTLVVDTNDNGFDFALNVSLGAPVAPPANDACAAAEGLTAHAPGESQVVSSTTFGAANDSEVCGARGADVFYALHLDQDARVTLNVNGSSASGTLLYVLDACSSGSPLANSCSSALDLYALPAGDYLVAVDGYDRAGNTFNLSVQLGAPVYPPPNDVCAAAPLLSPQAPGESDSASGTTFAATNDVSGSCGGYGPDVFYRLHLTQQASLSATLSNADGGFFGAVLYLQAGDCPAPVDGGFDFSSDLACSSSGYPVGLAAASLSPGYYTLVVDTNSNAGDSFGLSVSLADPVPPPANDACASPEALSPHVPGESQTVSGTTFGATDDGHGCYGQAPDVYYALHLDQDARVQAYAQSPFGQQSPLLSLIGGCGAPDAGAGSDGGATAVACSNLLDLDLVPAGDYLVVADGPRGGAPFDLQVSLLPPVYPPVNDRCTNAAALAPHNPGDSDQVSVETRGAADDQYTCGYGRDVYYALHLAQPASLVAYLSSTASDAGFNFASAALQLQSGCGAGGDAGPASLACNYGTLPTNLDLPSLPAGDYVLVVDDSLNDGPFTLDVSLGAPH